MRVVFATTGIEPVKSETAGWEAVAAGAEGETGP